MNNGVADSISSTSSESAAVRRERAAMEEQVRVMRGQAEVMEANRRRADDTVHRLERKVEDLQEELFRTYVPRLIVSNVQIKMKLSLHLSQPNDFQ